MEKLFLILSHKVNWKKKESSQLIQKNKNKTNKQTKKNQDHSEMQVFENESLTSRGCPVPSSHTTLEQAGSQIHTLPQLYMASACKWKRFT